MLAFWVMVSLLCIDCTPVLPGEVLLLLQVQLLGLVAMLLVMLLAESCSGRVSLVKPGLAAGAVWTSGLTAQICWRAAKRESLEMSSGQAARDSSCRMQSTLSRQLLQTCMQDSRWPDPMDSRVWIRSTERPARWTP
jgi:hypothetical protein